MNRFGASVASLLALVMLPGCAATPPDPAETTVRTEVTAVAPVATTSVEPTGSERPESVPITSVKGKTVAMAESRLERDGFKVRIKWKPSAVKRGRVIAQKPSGGTARTGTTILLTVSTGNPTGDSEEGSVDRLSSSDEAAQRAFIERRSGVPLSGTGTVARVLKDDDDGSRHQRFILRLGSGQTLLIAHNIDIAPRIGALAPGDTVSFRGVYEWNSEGGVIHWTHHDPDGSHAAGWLRHDGATYQ